MVNTGQMILVLGALLLFSLTLPSMNQSLLYNDRTLIATSAEIAAMSLAQKILAEAGTKAFDEVCLTTYVQNASQLTPIASLGKETGEDYPNFDDLDDYHNVVIVDSLTLPSVPFTISGTVAYRKMNIPGEIESSQTFIKCLRVTVTSPYLVNPSHNSPTAISLEQLYTLY